MDCVWSDWGAYTECTGICGTGTRNRTRKINVHQNHGGSDCVGDFTQVDSSCIISDNPECPGNYQKFVETLLDELITVESVYQNHVRSVNGMTWATVELHVAEDTKNKFGTYY